MPDTTEREMTPDEELLMSADSLLSFIRARESNGLTEQTIRDLDALLPKLRKRTDQIERAKRSIVEVSS